MAPKAFGARGIAAKEREVATIHQRDGAGDNAVDLLAQSRVLPFDGGDVARLGVKQDGCNFSPGHAFQFAIKRSDLEDQASTL